MRAYGVGNTDTIALTSSPSARSRSTKTIPQPPGARSGFPQSGERIFNRVGWVFCRRVRAAGLWTP